MQNFIPESPFTRTRTAFTPTSLWDTDTRRRDTYRKKDLWDAFIADTFVSENRRDAPASPFDKTFAQRVPTHIARQRNIAYHQSSRTPTHFRRRDPQRRAHDTPRATDSNPFVAKTRSLRQTPTPDSEQRYLPNPWTVIKHLPGAIGETVTSLIGLATFSPIGTPTPEQAALAQFAIGVAPEIVRSARDPDAGLLTHLSDAENYPHLAALGAATPFGPRGWTGFVEHLEQNPDWLIDVGLSIPGISVATKVGRGARQVTRAARQRLTPIDTDFFTDVDVLTGVGTQARQIADASVDITALGRRRLRTFGRREVLQVGQGVHLGGGEIATASHVLTGALGAGHTGPLDLQNVRVRTRGGRDLQAQALTGIQAESDLALIQTRGTRAAALRLSAFEDPPTHLPQLTRRDTDARIGRSRLQGTAGQSGAGFLTETGEFGIYLGTLGNEGLFATRETLAAFQRTARTPTAFRDLDTAAAAQALATRGLHTQHARFGDVGRPRPFALHSGTDPQRRYGLPERLVAHHTDALNFESILEEGYLLSGRAAGQRSGMFDVDARAGDDAFVFLGKPHIARAYGDYGLVFSADRLVHRYNARVSEKDLYGTYKYVERALTDDFWADARFPKDFPVRGDPFQVPAFREAYQTRIRSTQAHYRREGLRALDLYDTAPDIEMLVPDRLPVDEAVAVIRENRPYRIDPETRGDDPEAWSLQALPLVLHGGRGESLFDYFQRETRGREPRFFRATHTDEQTPAHKSFDVEQSERYQNYRYYRSLSPADRRAIGIRTDVSQPFPFAAGSFVSDIPYVSELKNRTYPHPVYRHGVYATRTLREQLHLGHYIRDAGGRGYEGGSELRLLTGTSYDPDPYLVDNEVIIRNHRVIQRFDAHALRDLYSTRGVQGFHDTPARDLMLHGGQTRPTLQRLIETVREKDLYYRATHPDEQTLRHFSTDAEQTQRVRSFLEDLRHYNSTVAPETPNFFLYRQFSDTIDAQLPAHRFVTTTFDPVTGKNTEVAVKTEGVFASQDFHLQSRYLGDFVRDEGGTQLRILAGEERLSWQDRGAALTGGESVIVPKTIIETLNTDQFVDAHGAPLSRRAIWERDPSDVFLADTGRNDRLALHSGHRRNRLIEHKTNLFGFNEIIERGGLKIQEAGSDFGITKSGGFDTQKEFTGDENYLFYSLGGGIGTRYGSGFLFTQNTMTQYNAVPTHRFLNKALTEKELRDIGTPLKDLYLNDPETYTHTLASWMQDKNIDYESLFLRDPRLANRNEWELVTSQSIPLKSFYGFYHKLSAYDEKKGTLRRFIEPPTTDPTTWKTTPIPETQRIPRFLKSSQGYDLLSLHSGTPDTSRYLAEHLLHPDWFNQAWARGSLTGHPERYGGALYFSEGAHYRKPAFEKAGLLFDPNQLEQEFGAVVSPNRVGMLSLELAAERNRIGGAAQAQRFGESHDWGVLAEIYHETTGQAHLFTERNTWGWQTRPARRSEMGGTEPGSFVSPGETRSIFLPTRPRVPDTTFRHASQLELQLHSAPDWNYDPSYDLEYETGFESFAPPRPTPAPTPPSRPYTGRETLDALRRRAVMHPAPTGGITQAQVETALRETHRTAKGTLADVGADFDFADRRGLTHTQRMQRWFFEQRGERTWGHVLHNMSDLATTGAVVSSAAQATVQAVRFAAGHPLEPDAFLRTGAEIGAAVGLYQANKRFGFRDATPERLPDWQTRRMHLAATDAPPTARDALIEIFQTAGAHRTRWGRGALARSLERYNYEELATRLGSERAEYLTTTAHAVRRFGQRSHQTKRNLSDALLGWVSGDFGDSTRYIYSPETRRVTAQQNTRHSIDSLLARHGDRHLLLSAWRERREAIRTGARTDWLGKIGLPLQHPDTQPHIGYMLIPEARGIGRFFNRYIAEPFEEHQIVKNWGLGDILKAVQTGGPRTARWLDAYNDRKYFRETRAEMLEDRRTTPELYAWQDPDHFFDTLATDMGIDTAGFSGFGADRLGSPYARWGRFFAGLPRRAKRPLQAAGVAGGGYLAYQAFFGGGDAESPLHLDDPAGYSLSPRYPLLGAVQRTRPYRRLRARAENFLDSTYGENTYHAEMLKSIGLGKKAAIPQDVKQTFVETGQIHALVQSGMHINLFTRLLGRYPFLGIPAAVSAIKDTLHPPNEIVAAPSQDFLDKYRLSKNPWVPRWNPERPSSGEIRYLQSLGELPFDYEVDFSKPAWAWWDPHANYAARETAIRQRKGANVIPGGGYLYEVRHGWSGKRYFGLSTRSATGRLQKHLTGKGSKAVAEELTIKGGDYTSHDFVTHQWHLPEGITYYQLGEWERKLIADFDTQATGYNRSAGGEIRDPTYAYQPPTERFVSSKTRLRDVVPWAAYTMFGVLPETLATFTQQPSAPEMQQVSDTERPRATPAFSQTRTPPPAPQRPDTSVGALRAFEASGESQQVGISERERLLILLTEGDMPDTFVQELTDKILDEMEVRQRRQYF